MSSSSNHSHSHHIHSTITTTTSTSSSSSSTKGNGNTQACAACKYQRRKCAPDCILAPYFPHDRQRQFLNAHKLFGVSNITKIIKHLDQPEKDEAMRTIIFQSDVRANDPVGGCYRIIRDLQRLIEYNKAELDIVLHQLAICRAQAQQQQQQQQNQIQIPEVVGDQNSCDELINVDPLSLYNNPIGHFHYLQPQHHHPLPAVQQEQQEVPYVLVHENSSNGSNNNNNNTVPHQHLQEDLSMWAMQDSMSSLDIKHANDCEDLKSFVEIPCDDQGNGEVSFQHEDIGDHQQSEEALLKVNGGSLNEEGESATQQVVQDHDLKGEATFFFTLTNCNS